MKVRICAAIAVLAALACGSAAAGPVTTGVVLRGVTPDEQPGKPGESAGVSCDFSKEDVDQNGRMEGASVQCKAKGDVDRTIKGMPTRFTAYCEVEARRLGGRLLTAPVPGNKNHCDLSDIKPKDATQEFGGAVWR